MSDIWHTVDTHPNYRFSGDGKIVQNVKTGRILKQCDNNKGYPTVNLYRDGVKTTIGMHRLVAKTCVDGEEPGLTVNHKDGNKHNNHPDNLEWATYSENEIHAHQTGLKHGPNRKPVRVKETGEVFPSVRECARVLGVCDTSIGRHIQDIDKPFHGLTFEYVDIDPDSIPKCDGTMSRACIHRERREKSIRVVETGRTYQSISECARDIGGDAPGIVGCLKGRHNTHRGLHYEYVD